MLILKVFINDKQIDEIAVKRVGRIIDSLRSDTFRYEIVKPAGIKKLIRHCYGYGWSALMKKILDTLPAGHGKHPYMGSAHREEETRQGKLRKRRPRIKKMAAGLTLRETCLLTEAEASAGLVDFFEPKEKKHG